MKRKKIRLNGINDIKELVRIAGKADFGIDVTSGHTVIDAASVLGLLSLNLSSPITLTYFGDSTDLEEFAVAHSA